MPSYSFLLQFTRVASGAAALAAVLAFGAAQPAHALTMQECSAKYKAAQSANTLNGVKWNEFRKAQCGTDASAAATPAAQTPAAKPTTPRTARSTPMNTGGAVFPNAVSSKYSQESAGKARMHTCLDQYNANKASNGNAGLKWIAKGGGYYSECNTRLKG